MNCPSKKRLMEAFNLDASQANLIRKLAHNADYSEDLENAINKYCPKTAAYANSCINGPYTSYMWRVTMAMHAIDVILGTHGVEPLGPQDDASEGFAPPYEYCNTGDSYAPTLIYDRAHDRLIIGSWGDIAESHADW